MKWLRPALRLSLVGALALVPFLGYLLERDLPYWWDPHAAIEVVLLLLVTVAALAAGHLLAFSDM